MRQGGGLGQEGGIIGGHTVLPPTALQGALLSITPNCWQFADLAEAGAIIWLLFLMY